MSNTDGEDTQRTHSEEEKFAFRDGWLARHKKVIELEQELASLREQLKEKDLEVRLPIKPSVKDFDYDKTGYEDALEEYQRTISKPLREHFEMDTDAGTTLRTFDYIDALEKYNEQLSRQKASAELDNLKLSNDLADALEIRQGKGPTALAMLYSEVKQQEEVIRELIPIAQERFEIAVDVVKCWVDDDKPNAEQKLKRMKAIIEKAKSLTTKDK